MVGSWLRADQLDAVDDEAWLGDALPGRPDRRVQLVHDADLPGVRGRLLAAREARDQPRPLPGPLDWHRLRLCLSDRRHPRRQVRAAPADGGGGSDPAAQLPDHHVPHARVAPCLAPQAQARPRRGQPGRHAPLSLPEGCAAARHGDRVVPALARAVRARRVRQLHGAPLRLDAGAGRPRHGPRRHVGRARSQAAGAAARLARTFHRLRRPSSRPSIAFDGLPRPAN